MVASCTDTADLDQWVGCVGYSSREVVMAKVDLTPRLEFGNQLTFLRGKEWRPTKLYSSLIADARRYLSKGTYIEIRKRLPYNYGREVSYAWYHCAGMKEEPGFPTEGENYRGGYFLICGLYL